MDYFFGHSALELQRLEAQAAFLRPITQRLFAAAGLKPGMTVLDLGCEAGDVSMLAAEMVGPNGRVVGLDFAEKATSLAARRTAEAGLKHVSYVTTSLDAFEPAEPFDLVCGRYVLLHQTDPSAFIRAAAAHVRPGGRIAFHEIDMRKGFETSPPAALFDEATAELMDAIRSTVPRPDAAGSLLALFAEAGLEPPQMFCERPMGGGQSAVLHRWIAATLAVTRALKRPTEPECDVDALTAELAKAVSLRNSQILGADQCCVWTAVSSKLRSTAAPER